MSGVTAPVFLNHRHQMCGQLQVLSDLLAGKATPGAIRHRLYGSQCLSGHTAYTHLLTYRKGFAPLRNSNLNFQLVHTLAC
jgi:hypothetical protein